MLRANNINAVKAAFHDTDVDIDTDSPDTPTSLRPTRAISSRGFSRGIARVGVGVVKCGLIDNLYSPRMVANNRKNIQYTIKAENNLGKLNYSTTYKTLSIIT